MVTCGFNVELGFYLVAILTAGAVICIIPSDWNLLTFRFGPCIDRGSTYGRLVGGIYAGVDEIAVEIGYVLLAIVPRFAITSIAIVICGGATTRFATAGSCAPTKVLGFDQAPSVSIGFGTTVGCRGAEVDGWFIERAALRTAIEEPCERYKLVNGFSWFCSACRHFKAYCWACSLFVIPTSSLVHCTFFPILPAVVFCLLLALSSSVPFPIALAPNWFFRCHRVSLLFRLWLFIDSFMQHKSSRYSVLLVNPMPHFCAPTVACRLFALPDYGFSFSCSDSRILQRIVMRLSQICRQIEFRFWFMLR